MSETRAFTAVRQLRQALEQTAGALARPDLDGLLASEAATERALAGLPWGTRPDGPLEPALREEIDAARRALIRCTRLGASLQDFVRLSSVARQMPGYGPAVVSESCAGHALDEQV
jgi:hypothetical protein